MAEYSFGSLWVYMSFAKSWQEKGYSSQAETWQVKNILMKDFYVFHGNMNNQIQPQAAQAHYLRVRASEVIWSEYTRIISVLSDAK